MRDLGSGSGIKISKKLIISVAVVIFAIIGLFNLCGINNAGFTTIVQYPWGTLNVVKDPGLYLQLFGKTTLYHKEGTYSFLIPTETDIKTQQVDPKMASRDEELSSTVTQALPIRYNDGGTGHIYGKARFRMPASDEAILKIHYAFRSYEHLAEALYKVTTQNVMNLTAALMSSEESYTTAKEKFQRWAEDQMLKGPFETQLMTVKVEGETGKTEEVQKATIKYGPDGKALHSKSPLADYMVQVSQLQIINFTYEPNTLAQIQKKRTALMAIIQAKAEAEEAMQKKITAEAEGEKNVMIAKYEKEVEKQKAVVDAMRDKEVAVIGAKKFVEVNEQKLAASKLDKLAAEQEKMAAIERGKGEAEARRLKMEADSALEAKLNAWIKVNEQYANAIKEYQGQWVPSVVMGKSDGKDTNGAQTLIDLLTAKTAKDISLDLSVQKKATQDKK